MLDGRIVYVVYVVDVGGTAPVSVLEGPPEAGPELWLWLSFPSPSDG